MKRLEKKILDKRILDNMVIMKKDGNIIKAFQGFVYPGGSGGGDDMGGFGLWLLLQMLKDALTTIESISEQMSDLGKSKDKVCYVLVNENSWLTKDAPTRKVFDMNLVYLILMEPPKGELMAMRITDDVAKEMGLTEEQLYILAKQNTPKIFPVQQIRESDLADGLNEILAGKIQLQDARMVTNKMHMNGAVSVLYEDVLKNISDENLTNEILVIPTSIHEMVVCLVEKEILDEREHMLALLNKINSMNPDKQSSLSQNIYFYDRETDAIGIL